MIRCKRHGGRRDPKHAIQCAFLLVAAIAISGCGRSDNPPPPQNVTVPPSATAAAAPPSAARRAVVDDSPRAFPTEGLTVGGECPASAEDAKDMQDAESAIVPLKAGLTLSLIWVGGSDDYDHECLDQVAAVTASYVDFTTSCPHGEDHHDVTHRRRVCRADLRNAHFYATKDSNELPQVMRPTTSLSLSTKSFQELKKTGDTPHRYVEITDEWRTRANLFDRDFEGVLHAGPFDREPYSVQVNGRMVELPTIVAHANGGSNRMTTTRMVDDERFPLMLDYEIPGIRFRVQYTRISYPASSEMEHQLAVEKKVDVYGIYFDFASDRMRPESTAVLAEIAGILAKNADWTLSINGHTDNVGGDASNLELSRKRAAAVKSALVERYGISADRLSTDGSGAGQPQDTNDTPEGRARNRRVVLTRR